MSDLTTIVAGIADAMDADAGVKEGEPSHSVVITTVTPDGKVETFSNMEPDSYRDFFRFMAQQTATGQFTMEKVEPEPKQ